MGMVWVCKSVYTLLVVVSSPAQPAMSAPVPCNIVAVDHRTVLFSPQGGTQVSELTI